MRIWVNTHGQEAAALLQQSCRQKLIFFCPFFFSLFLKWYFHPLYWPPTPFSLLPNVALFPSLLGECMLSNSIPIPAHYRKQMGIWAKFLFLDQHQAFRLLRQLMLMIFVFVGVTLCEFISVFVSQTEHLVNANFLPLHSFILTHVYTHSPSLGVGSKGKVTNVLRSTQYELVLIYLSPYQGEWLLVGPTASLHCPAQVFHLVTQQHDGDVDRWRDRDRGARHRRWSPSLALSLSDGSFRPTETHPLWGHQPARVKPRLVSPEQILPLLNTSYTNKQLGLVYFIHFLSP